MVFSNNDWLVTEFDGVRSKNMPAEQLSGFGVGHKLKQSLRFCNGLGPTGTLKIAKTRPDVVPGLDRFLLGQAYAGQGRLGEDGPGHHAIVNRLT